MMKSVKSVQHMHITKEPMKQVKLYQLQMPYSHDIIINVISH